MQWRAPTTPTKRIRGRRGQQMRRTFLGNNPLCMGPDSMCEREGRITAATIRDHTIPLAEGGHDGPGNEQALCVACHDIKSAHEAQRGIRREFDPAVGRLSADALDRQMPSDLALSRIPVTIVCGPPGAGKSTYVEQRAHPFDVVIDLDRITAILAARPLHQVDPATQRRLLPLALAARNDALRSLATDTLHRRAWFIVSAPSARERATWARRLGGDVVVLDVPMSVCLERLRADATRSPACIDQSCKVAARWWALQRDDDASR